MGYDHRPDSRERELTQGYSARVTHQRNQRERHDPDAPHLRGREQVSSPEDRRGGDRAEDHDADEDQTPAPRGRRADLTRSLPSTSSKLGLTQEEDGKQQ